MSKNGKLDQDPQDDVDVLAVLDLCRPFRRRPGVLVFVVAFKRGTRNLRTGTRIFELQDDEDEILQLRRPGNRGSQLG